MRLRRWLLRPVAIAVSSCFTQGWCNPTGPHIVNGAVTFQRPDARTLNVTNSPGAIINWRGFSIGANEVTRFVQQSASSAVLNRVVGADVSRIYGQLLSNGRVFLVNPAGIVIGPGAVIDTASLVASTLNLTDADFLAGKLRFRGDENSGPIVNQGSIRTGVGGHAILIAPNVENAGLIEAPGGSILLAAGQKLTIGSIDLPGVQFEIQAPSDSVVNVGKLIADGGAVGAFAGTLRHSGDIRANALTRDEAGRVVLEGQSSVMVAGGSTTIANGGTGGNISIESGDTTLVSGEVTAAGTAGRGGTVQILGDRVGILDRARVSASGERGGGTILIGGDVHGENPQVRNASGTFVGSDATVTADAVTRGDGGRIVVWANEATRVHGRLSARGADGGKGGFVETSGRYLEVTRAPQIGAGGTWLLDPRDIEVIAGESTNIGEPPTFLPIDDNSKLGAAQINAQLDEGVNVVIDTVAAGSQQGDLTINAPIVQVSGISSNASLTLNAANSVTVNADIVLAGGDINVTTGSATGAMTVNSATVRTDGAMHLDLAGALVVQTANASDARLHASAGQAISARSVVVTTSGSGSASISNGAGGQTIAVNNANAGSGIDVVSTGSGVARISNGFSDDGLPIARPGPQSITIDEGDRLQVIGRGGTAMIESAADQFIALRGTGANQIVLGAANAAGSALIQASGSQFASAGSRGQRGGVTLVGGVAEGTSASIRTIGPLGSQNVSTSGTISAVGGSAIGSEGPSASADAGIRHEGAGPQVISAESIVLRGGTGGGTDNDGFIASIEGAQFINAGVGGITLVGGSGGDGNDAHITQFGIASPQTITVATGGSIVLQGGSSPGFGKRAAITAFGPSQLIEFVDPGSGQASAAGVSTPSGDASLAAASATRSRVSAPGGGIVVIGGSVGAANEATIVSDGTQTITGSPDLTLTGGASGGQRGSGNAATIRSSVSQDFTLGTVHLSGGAGGIDNYASIEAPIQSISTQGALTLIGSSGGSGFSGARIGGLADGRTALALSVGGALILSGGAASDGESALGASALSFTAQDAGISIFAEGDVTLNGGSAAGSRIGQPAGLLGSGDIAIASGGNIVLGGGASAASAIRTSGEVTLVADSPGKSISQAANSSIVANTLTASADSGVNLSGANQVGAFVIASGGDVMYNSAGSLILDADSSITTPAGVQAVTITTSGGASDIVLTGNFDGSGDNYAFASGRDILFGAGTTFGAGGLTLAGAGRARFPSGTVTLNTPLTANVPLELSGATVNFNAATVANAGLALSAGTLQGSGDVSVTGGVFQWSGGVVSGPANFTTASATNVTGPVLLDARTWNNASAVSLTGPARIDFTGNAVINNQGPGAWDLASSDATAMAGSARFNNAGTLSNSAGAISRTIAVQLTNTGRIDVDAGTLVLTDFPTNAGTVALNSGATLSTNGAPLANFGLISGTGTVDLGGASGGTLTNNGTVAPETLVIDGNFVQSSAGTLAIEIGGTTPGVTHDVLQVNGNANLGGTLLVNYVGGFAPAVGDAFNFLTYASGSGDFSTFVFPPGASALPGTAGLTEYQLALNPLLPDPTLVRTGLFERTANEILRDQVRMTQAVTEELVETAQAELQATEQQREGLSRTAVRQCN